MRPQIEAALRQHGIEDRVTITGWAGGDRVREEILSARAMVLPSFAEGLPVVIMEALGLERPVLSTYVAGIPELVTPDNGWLIPAGSVDAIAEGVREVLDTPPERLADMGARGRAAVLERHDVSVTGAALHALLEQYVA